MSEQKGRGKTLTGAAGEYYLAFRLAGLGYAVGLTTRGLKTIDIIAASSETAKAITIQTKTASKAYIEDKDGSKYWQWPIGIAEYPESGNFYYAFIDLKGDLLKTPDVFILPSTKLKSLRINNYPKTGKTTMRWLGIDKDSKEEKNYKNRWDIFQKALD